MIRAVLVDDEEPARERLRRLLSEVPDVDIAGEADDGERAMEEIARLAPDVVFLDIQMPGCTGMEVAASLPSPRPHIIFCTAFDQYAVDAFELSAVDYLLKPINRARLAQALDRVRGGVKSDEALEKATLAAAPPSRFLARRGSGYRVVPGRDVLCFVSEDGLTKLVVITFAPVYHGVRVLETRGTPEQMRTPFHTPRGPRDRARGWHDRARGRCA